MLKKVDSALMRDDTEEEKKAAKKEEKRLAKNLAAKKRYAKNKDKINLHQKEYRARPDVKKARKIYQKKWNKEYWANNVNGVKEKNSAAIQIRSDSLILTQTKASAKRQNMEFDEAYVKTKIIETTHCEMTQILFDTSPRSSNCRTRPFIKSVDRIDSTKGYIKGNIRIVCWCVNRAKAEWPEEVFNTMCVAVVKHMKLATCLKSE
jgi:hypothetical protein